MFRSSKSALAALAFLVTASAAEAQLDFTTYVAVGDSLTAGFISASLVESGQINSYPALLNRQATGQTGGFEQPLVSQPGIPGVLRLTSLVPVIVAPSAGRGTPLNIGLARPYNNLAVPGADARDVLTRVTDGGGLHDLILRGRGTQVQQARLLNPTFVSIWVGNNDALAAATMGVVNDDTLTPLASFEADYRAIVAQLALPGVELVIANIPDVVTIPYVTTVPPVVVNPQTQQPVLVNGNPVPLIGPNGPLTAGDRVLLPATTVLAQGIGIPSVIPGGTGRPLPDSLVLSAAEIATIRARITAFNTVIRTVANERNAAFVDANALLTRAATSGLQVGGINYTPAFLTGGIFSYDGVHPTSFGYAYIANEFIAAINQRYDSDIPPVNLAPFVFGTAPGAGLSSATAALELSGTAIFSPAARENLIWALRADQRTPPRQKRPRLRLPLPPG